MPKITTTNQAPKRLADKRVLEVMDFIIANRIQGVNNETTFLLTINYNSPKNLKLIRDEVQSFQLEHLQNLCTMFSVNADFLLNSTCNTMFTELDKTTPLHRLKVAVKELDIFMKEIC